MPSRAASSRRWASNRSKSPSATPGMLATSSASPPVASSMVSPMRRSNSSSSMSKSSSSSSSSSPSSPSSWPPNSSCAILASPVASAKACARASLSHTSPGSAGDPAPASSAASGAASASTPSRNDGGATSPVVSPADGMPIRRRSPSLSSPLSSASIQSRVASSSPPPYSSRLSLAASSSGSGSNPSKKGSSSSRLLPYPSSDMSCMVNFLDLRRRLLSGSSWLKSVSQPSGVRPALTESRPGIARFSY
mmetsp:Transcript_23689/g.52934  ORF Transcript_23689/g.52934 Transcript_23689/m.52934 type:complete len:250 (+) Transcript_23689:1261-2010(+)